MLLFSTPSHTMPTQLEVTLTNIVERATKPICTRLAALEARLRVPERPTGASSESPPVQTLMEHIEFQFGRSGYKMMKGVHEMLHPPATAAAAAPVGDAFAFPQPPLPLPMSPPFRGFHEEGEVPYEEPPAPTPEPTPEPAPAPAPASAPVEAPAQPNDAEFKDNQEARIFMYLNQTVRVRSPHGATKARMVMKPRFCMPWDVVVRTDRSLFTARCGHCAACGAHADCAVLLNLLHARFVEYRKEIHGVDPSYDGPVG